LLSLVTPAWLAGLLLVPVIRWLHRGGAHRRVLPVSHLGLWQGSAASAAAAVEGRKPDPAWRRRALLAALLLLALAGPQFALQRHRITLWIDDSLSMLTREAEGSRLALGLAQARAALAALGDAEVEVRTLGDPWRDLGPAAVEARVAAGRKPPAVPPAALLGRERLHWLVTDGAHAELQRWPAPHRPDRIVQVGAADRNVGLVRLAARRHAADPGRLDLLLDLINGGAAAETRELVWRADGTEVARSTQRLGPAASAQVNLVLAAAKQVSVILEPADALAEDDRIAIDLGSFRRRAVAVDATCPKAVAAAVAVHPALVAAGGGQQADAAVHCAAQEPPGRLPVLRIHGERTPVRAGGLPMWSPPVPHERRWPLAAERLPLAASLQPRPGDRVLLALGSKPAIIARAGVPPAVDTSLDFASMGAAGGSEAPLLLDLMLEQLLGQRLLDPVVAAERDPAVSKVVPSAPEARAAPPRSAPTLERDLTRWLLGAALIVALWEIAALMGQWARARQAGEAA
jgi:hypothetical protein